MHTPSNASPIPQPDALRRLLDSVLAGDDVTLFIRSDDGRALLDAAAGCLSKLRFRALRVAEAPPDGLGLATLMAQVTGQPYSSAQNDEFLRRGFQALTTLDETCDGIVLLVSDANALQPAALRYIQLACRAGANLRLVLAGRRGFLDLLAPREFAHLRARLAMGPIITPSTPAPVPMAIQAAAAAQAGAPARSAPPAPAFEASDAASLALDASLHERPMSDYIMPEQLAERTEPWPGLPMPSGFSSQSYRRRRLAAFTGIGLATAACIALAIGAYEAGDHASPEEQAVLVIEPLAVPGQAVAAAPAAQPTGVAAAIPEAPAPKPAVAANEAGANEGGAPASPALASSVPPQLAAPPPVPTPSSPKSVARRSTPAQPRAVAARAPAANAGSVAAWEDAYPPAPREWRSSLPPQAMSSLPEQAQSYIGTYATDANGVRVFRFNR